MPTLRQGAGKSAGNGAVRLEPDAPKRQLEPDNNPPAAGKKWPCTLTGYTSAVVSLFLFVILFFAGDPLAPQNTAIELILLLIWFSSGLILLLHRHREPRTCYINPLLCCGNRRKSQELGYSCGCWEVFFSLWQLQLHQQSLLTAVQSFLEQLAFLLLFLEYGCSLQDEIAPCSCSGSFCFVYQQPGKTKEAGSGTGGICPLTVNRSIQLLDANREKAGFRRNKYAGGIPACRVDRKYGSGSIADTCHGTPDSRTGKRGKHTAVERGISYPLA